MLILAATLYVQPAYAQEVAATTPADATASGQPAAVKPVAQPAKEPLPISIFFTPEELQRMRAAFVAYEKSKMVKISDAESKANDFLNQLTDSEPKRAEPPVEKTYVYPQFFLNSLVFHAQDDWVVLVNNQRFSAKGAQDDSEIKVLAVDSEKVLLEWKPKKMDRVLESWANNVNESADVDPLDGTVEFTLRPNQTFSSYAMRVLEGKVRPVMIVINTGQDTNGDAQSNDAPPAEGEEKIDEPKKIENITTEDIKNDVGVKGLNKTYKRIGLEE